MLGNSLPVGPVQQTTENYPNFFGLTTIKENVIHVYISSGMVHVVLYGLECRHALQSDPGLESLLDRQSRLS